MAPISIAIVGLGQRSFNKAIDAIIMSPDLWALVAATDPDFKARSAFQSRCPDVPVFETTDMMLQWNAQQSIPTLKAVYVAVPHHIYRQVVPLLLQAYLHVLKEKLAATSIEEVMCLQELAVVNAVLLSTASQRRYGKDIAKMKEWLPLIGTIHNIEATRKICVANLAEGWRANQTLSGGGAMADIGWHLLDMIVGLVGATPDCPPSVLYSKLFHVRSHQGYDCEDSAEIILGFPSSSNGMTAHLSVSRIGHKQIESVTITGVHGVLAFDGHEVTIHFEPTSGKQHLVSDSSKRSEYQSDVSLMFADFHQEMANIASLIFGHYNKRCKIEIPADHHLCQFSLTGAGLKNRAHPLAISIALNQLRKLRDSHAWKSTYARQLASKLACIPFLEMPMIEAARGAEPAGYAFVMRFKAAKAPPGLTREVFVKALHSHDLSDVNIPKSTGLLQREPLFNKPWAILPHLYSEEYSVNFATEGFTTAQQFYDEAIKLPVYATKNDQVATDRYVDIIIEVATEWMACNPTTV